MGINIGNKPLIETDEDYQKLIPPWCQFQGVEDHKEILALCWGITGGCVRLDNEDYCRGCEFYVEKLGDTIQRDAH